MPKTGDRAQESGEYTADCAHWAISMRSGWEFPPCPQCHQVVEYARRSVAPVTGHEWGDVVPVPSGMPPRHPAAGNPSEPFGQGQTLFLASNRSIRKSFRHGFTRLHSTR
jgi:hypothetical protein